jgi:hypothetical protein
MTMHVISSSPRNSRVRAVASRKNADAAEPRKLGQDRLSLWLGLSLCFCVLLAGLSCVVDAVQGVAIFGELTTDGCLSQLD